MQLTAIYMKFPEGYAAFVEELPGTNTQGETLAEARENLAEAVQLILDANRQLAEDSLASSRAGRHPRTALDARIMKRQDLIRHLERHGC